MEAANAVRRPRAEQPPGKQFLRKEQVALRYQITERTVDRMAEDGRLPPPIKLGRFPLWDRDQLDARDEASARAALQGAATS
jgi:predicted DNA-binding transcriptional regulator AlpA